MNEMRKLMEIVEQSEAIVSPSVDRYIIRHATGAYISNFSFGDNSKITQAKLFLTLQAAEIHLEGFDEGWKIIPVEVTIKEKK